MSVIEASRSGEGLQFGPESKARNDRLRAEQLRIWTAYNLLEKYDDDDYNDACLLEQECLKDQFNIYSRHC